MSYAQPSQVANSISTSISNVIMSSIQTAQNSYVSSQTININCDPEITKVISDQFQYCVESLSKLKYSTDDIKKLCTIPVFCKADNVSMKFSANITNLTNQVSEIKSGISTSLSNSISQNLSNLSPDILSLIAGGNKDITQSITDITNAVSNNITSVLQDIYNIIQQSSTLTLTNYSANNVSFSQISDITDNLVQSNKTIQDSITTISDVLSQTATKSQSSLMNTIKYIFIIVITIIVVAFIILFFIKKNTTREFFGFIIPYVLFFMVAGIVIFVNIYIKPKWVLQDNNTTLDNIDTGKLIFYSALPIILFGLIEIFYFRYKNSHNSNSTNSSIQDNTKVKKTDSPNFKSESTVTLNTEKVGKKLVIKS